MSPIKMSPSEYADKQASRLKAAVPEIQRGIERVTESPTAKAADKQDKMLTNLTKSVQDGTWAKRLKSVTLEEWKAKALSKGVGRIAAGIDAARPKTVAFAEQFFPHLEAIQVKLDKMPDLTLEDNINRAVFQMREAAKFKKK